MAVLLVLDLAFWALLLGAFALARGFIEDALDAIGTIVGTWWALALTSILVKERKWSLARVRSVRALALAGIEVVFSSW